MSDKRNIRCGDCRNFWADGEVNGDGERYGYCDEFPVVRITESMRCDGAAYHPKFTKKGEVKK